MSDARPFLLSVIVPCYNDAASIGETHARLTAALGNIPGCDYEIVLINDGSPDDTFGALKMLAERDGHCKAINLSRNFGHQIAITAGMEFARGDVVVVIDSDLQDPPEVIADMIRLWRDGNHVVYGQRTDRPGETALKLASAKWFYRLLNMLSDTDIPLDTGDFRLMDRKVVDVLRAMPERDRFVRGMVSWIGFRQVALPYKRDKRFAGTSGYSFLKLMGLALDGVLSFSSKPLRIATGIGALCALVSLVGIVYALALRLFTSIWVPGWTLLFIAVTLIGGVQLLCFGVLGEYVGRIYSEIKRRPLYIIDETVNLDRKSKPNGA
jgi:dolichol-phosphate mannosyltransferase